MIFQFQLLFFLLIAALYLKKHDLLKHNDHFDYDFFITVNFILTMAFFLIILDLYLKNYDLPNHDNFFYFDLS